MKAASDVAVSGDGAGEFVVRMAKAIGAHAGSTAVFSSPVKHGGTTVIPVARSIWGFGGGSGTVPAAANSPDGTGTGGGGGVVVQPLGYIVMQDGSVSYRTISPVPLLLLAGSAGLAGAAVAVLIRR